MSTSKVFNPQTLLHYTENDSGLASQLAAMGRHDMPDFLSKAEELGKLKNYFEASRSIHSLKGVAGALGAEKLFENCLSCETCLKREEDTENIYLYFNKIREELEKLFKNPEFLLYSDDRDI